MPHLRKGLAFPRVYRYIIRYIIRNRISACKVLFTLGKAEDVSSEEYMELLDEFGNHIRESLRKSDILMRNRKNQYFVFLTDIREDVTLTIYDWDALADTLGEKAAALRRVLQDAGQENPSLTVLLLADEDEI